MRSRVLLRGFTASWLVASWLCGCKRSVCTSSSHNNSKGSWDSTYHLSLIDKSRTSWGWSEFFVPQFRFRKANASSFSKVFLADCRDFRAVALCLECCRFALTRKNFYAVRMTVSDKTNEIDQSSAGYKSYPPSVVSGLPTQANQLRLRLKQLGGLRKESRLTAWFVDSTDEGSDGRSHAINPFC